MYLAHLELCFPVKSEENVLLYPRCIYLFALLHEQSVHLTNPDHTWTIQTNMKDCTEIPQKTFVLTVSATPCPTTIIS